MASCGLVRWPTHGQGASRELISSCRSAGVVSKQHHGPHHCCGRRRSNAEFESLCSRFVEHASTCTTQPLRSMVSATSMRKRRRGALREAPGSDSVRVPRAAHSSPVKLSIAYGTDTDTDTDTEAQRLHVHVTARRPPLPEHSRSEDLVLRAVLGIPVGADASHAEPLDQVGWQSCLYCSLGRLVKLRVHGHVNKRRGGLHTTGTVAVSGPECGFVGEAARPSVWKQAKQGVSRAARRGFRREGTGRYLTR